MSTSWHRNVIRWIILLYRNGKSVFFFYSGEYPIKEQRKIPTGELLFVWRHTFSSSGDPTGYEYICKTPFWQAWTFASSHKNDTWISDHSVYVFRERRPLCQSITTNFTKNSSGKCLISLNWSTTVPGQSSDMNIISSQNTEIAKHLFLFFKQVIQCYGVYNIVKMFCFF